MKKIAVLAMLFLVLGSVVALAADNPNAAKVPKYVWVQIEQYQAGKQTPYMKLGQMFKEAMAGTEFTWLAAIPVAGNGNEVTYVMLPDSFAFVEKAMTAFMKAGGEMQQKNAALTTEGMAAVEHSRSFIAELQPELSILPGKLTPAETTGWRVTTFRIKPGSRFEFAAFLKELRAMHDKAGDHAPSFVYWVIAGEPSPAFVLVTPLKTLADLDEPPSPAFQELYTPLFKEHVFHTIKNTVAALGTTIYMLDPRLSLPPKNYVAENPGFWQVKEPAPGVAKEKKGKKAPDAAAIKEKEKEKK